MLTPGGVVHKDEWSHMRSSTSIRLRVSRRLGRTDAASCHSAPSMLT